MSRNDSADVLKREIEYHEKLYSGFAQKHFARPAVRALRRHLSDRIRHLTECGPNSRILSLGCGIGDTELILAGHVGEVVGIDISHSGIQQARADALRLGISNAVFDEARVEDVSGTYDAVVAIVFLHHLPDATLEDLPHQVIRLLKPGGIFYSLDPSARRLSGAVGRLLIPWMMRRYQTTDERELAPEATAEIFRRTGFDVRDQIYDFGSTPLAGLLPAWEFGYRISRRLDDALLRIPVVSRVGSNFELIARRP